jgi:hypothetical protein
LFNRHPINNGQRRTSDAEDVGCIAKLIETSIPISPCQPTLSADARYNRDYIAQDCDSSLSTVSVRVINQPKSRIPPGSTTRAAGCPVFA